MEVAEIIKKIQRLEIKTKGLTKQVFSGEYHSAFKGKGMAFSEVREYQLGDEVRTIDWNVTARFGNPFVKVFEEERELTVMLMIDLSGSNTFGLGSKSKKELAIEIAAVLLFSAISNKDKVGAIFITDKVEKYIPAGKGRNHALLILRHLIEFHPENKGTNLNEGLKFFRNTQKKRCIAFLISDFQDENNFIEGIKLSSKKHDLVGINIKDKSEFELPKLGIVQLYNAETNKASWVNTNAVSVQAKFKNQAITKQNRIIDEFKKAGVDLATITTDEDYIPILMKLFKKRG